VENALYLLAMEDILNKEVNKKVGEEDHSHRIHDHQDN
jgi:hypothetical protein